MLKKSPHKINKTDDSQNSAYRLPARLLIFFAVIIIAIFIGDMYNLADFFNIHLRFDWAAIICAFVSALATIALGIVSIKQNNKLAEINNEQLESSIVAKDYPLIKFCKEQIVLEDSDIFKLKFYDTRNTPLKEIYVKNMKLVPYSGAYKVDETRKPIWVQKKPAKIRVKYTPYHEKNDDSEGFYFADIVSDHKVFQKHQYYRIEFDLDVISTSGVVSLYKYRLLVKRSDSINESKNRRYPKVYHQFYEFEDIMSAKKYKKRKSDRTQTPNN